RPPLFGKSIAMTSHSWIRKLFGRRQPGRRGAQPQAARRFRPALEALEDRLAPATLTVNTTQDDATTVNTSQLTLRDAIYLVDFHGNYQLIPGNTATSMPSGWASQITGTFGSSDTIQFDPGLTSGGAATITLTQTLPRLSRLMTINGPGANLLAVSGNHS